MHVQSGFAGEKPLSWRGGPGFKPILLLLGFGLFILAVLAPAPQGLLDLITQKAPSGYKLDRGTETIWETVNKKLRPDAFKAYQAQKEGKAAQQDKPQVATEEGAHQEVKPLLSKEQVAFLAKLMVLLLLLCAYLWGTESLPLGATDLLVAVVMYVFAVMPINDIARAYMQDAVFFIFGILAVAVGVGKTGLDKRIGLILLALYQRAQGLCLYLLSGHFHCRQFPVRARPGGPADSGAHGRLQGHLPDVRGGERPGPGPLPGAGHVLCRQPRRTGLPGRRGPQRHHGGLPDGQRHPHHLRRLDEVRHALCSGGLRLHRLLHVYDAPAPIQGQDLQPQRDRAGRSEENG